MEINWRSTRLRTNDAIYLDIPNNEIVRQTIVNLHYPTQVMRCGFASESSISTTQLSEGRAFFARLPAQRVS